MAQYFYDPSVLAVQDPAPDWERVNGINANIIEGTPNTLRTGSGSGTTTRHAYYSVLDTDAERNRAEIFVAYLVFSDTIHAPMLRWSGVGTSGRNGYYLRITPTSVVIRKAVSNSLSLVATASSLSLSGALKLRFRADGSALKVKWWLGEDEPDWLLEATDTSITQAGQMGMMSWEPGAGIYSGIGFGTNGDPAPTGPVEASAEGFLLRHNPHTNKVVPVLTSPTYTDLGSTSVRPRVTKGF